MQEFRDGTKHIRVFCRLHVGVYAPWDDEEREALRAKDPDHKTRRLDYFDQPPP